MSTEWVCMLARDDDIDADTSQTHGHSLKSHLFLGGNAAFSVCRFLQGGAIWTCNALYSPEHNFWQNISDWWCSHIWQESVYVSKLGEGGIRKKESMGKMERGREWVGAVSSSGGNRRETVGISVELERGQLLATPAPGGRAGAGAGRAGQRCGCRWASRLNLISKVNPFLLSRLILLVDSRLISQTAQTLQS